MVEAPEDRLAIDRPEMGTPPERTRVLYIGGWGRSGSTLLARMLDRVEGLVYVGEIRDLFLRGGVEDRLCGCGQRFSECPFWTAVGREAFGGWHLVDRDEMLAFRAGTDRPWYVPLLLKRNGTSAYHDRVHTYAKVLERVYQAITRVSGADVVIDASKVPSFALILWRMRDVDLRVVHLVRDSRGTIFSWQKQVALTDTWDSGRRMIRYNAMAAASRYTIYNTQTHMLGWAGLPYLLVRYEDLVAHPREHLERIVQHAGVEWANDGDGFLRDGAVKLDVSHSVIGNPMRLSRGWIDLRLDEEWSEKMSPRQRAVVSAMTSPLLARYGYPLSTAR